MKKNLFLIFFVLVIFLILSLSQVSAQDSDNSSADPAIPEKSGVYKDPKHPGIKVRVFVHTEKPPKVSSASLACGLADPDSSMTVSAAGWHLPSSWIYNLNPNSTPSSIGSGNLEAITANGFGDWSNATGNKVTINRGSDTTVQRSAYDGKNIIAWGRTQGTALGVTYIRYSTSTRSVVDVDTVLNIKFPWKWANSNTCAYPDAYDGENILTHEQGHWVGLDDEYDADKFKDATMYGYGSKGEVKKTTLTTGDKAGAASIY